MKILPLIFAALCTLPAAALGDTPESAPPFSLRTPDGVKKSLADYRGKVVVLEFFASWCHTCAASVSKLNELQAAYPDKLAVIGIATAEDDPHGLEAYMEDTRPEFTILVDSRDTVARRYKALMFPSFFIVDPQGRIAAQQRGPVKWEHPKVRAVLEDLFPSPATAAGL